MSLTTSALLLSAAALVHALPPSVPLHLDKGFWFGDFTVGQQTFTLPIDTGSFAILIEQGKYLPSPTSQQTNLSEFIQFNGASEDGTGPAEETPSFVLDDVTFAGVTVSKFLVGNITVGDPLPGDGVAGFSPPASDFSGGDPTQSSGQGLIETLCDSGVVSPCQFGLTLGKDGNGTFIFGEMDTSKISGEVTTVPTTPRDSWTVRNTSEADSPLLVVDGKSFGQIRAGFDSGSPNIIGPLDQVRTILQSVGYNISQQTDDSGITVALGTYDCSRAPARFGFSFPPSSAIHYIDAGANVLNRTADGKICTANVLGTSTVGPADWSIGQTWFQGRYVQHDLDNNTISFADLAE
ncbi:acid protease [Polyporus arcularius HHB13444]|uniref:Acid protease n=1 Tax=Polyporus arcularius HHB13444 TaxID=1314778 RepID=A0A5C3NN22_9APHY|nr:acid protease [Polyporus arcularius HHB13444]